MDRSMVGVPDLERNLAGLLDGTQILGAAMGKLKKDYVVHCRRSKFDVYIGRPSKWGNPFKIGVDGTRLEVIAKYEQYVRNTPELMESLAELKGKVLGCWCRPEPCHGDVLRKLIKEGEGEL